MKLVKALSIVVFITLFAIGCGSEAEDTSINLTGTWNGNYAYEACLNLKCNQYNTTATFEIDQSDNSVTGSYSTSESVTGSIIGNVVGSTFNFTVSETHPCVATLYGSGTISGNNIEYDLFGTVCTKDNSGSGSVTKE